GPRRPAADAKPNPGRRPRRLRVPPPRRRLVPLGRGPVPARTTAPTLVEGGVVPRCAGLRRPVGGHQQPAGRGLPHGPRVGGRRPGRGPVEDPPAGELQVPDPAAGRAARTVRPPEPAVEAGRPPPDGPATSRPG